MKKHFTYLLGIVCLISISSCSSWIESTRKMVGGDKPRKKQKDSKWVSQSQYNDLLVKYKNLSEKYNTLKEKKSITKNQYDHGNEMTKPKKGQDVETVDVFGDDGLANEVSQSLDKVAAKVEVPRPKPMSPNDVDQEVKTYKKAVLLKANGKINDSLKVFQYLEKSQTKQIKVRSRIHIGEIYLTKKQYDLALQVFESVIHQNAFSSRVLDALNGAVLASDQLGLTDKKLRYQSMLTDVFGIKG